LPATQDAGLILSKKPEGNRMLKLPTKPKLKIEVTEDSQYLITFLSAIKNEDEFTKLIRLHLEKNLDGGDSLSDPQWSTKSVTLTTQDIGAFEKRLNFVQIVTGITFNPKS
jgi:hypothetical protein